MLSSAAALLAAFLSILLTDAWTLRIDLVHQYTKPTF